MKKSILSVCATLVFGVSSYSLADVTCDELKKQHTDADVDYTTAYENLEKAAAAQDLVKLEPALPKFAETFVKAKDAFDKYNQTCVKRTVKNSWDCHLLVYWVSPQIQIQFLQVRRRFIRSLEMGRPDVALNLIPGIVITQNGIGHVDAEIKARACLSESNY